LPKKDDRGPPKFLYSEVVRVVACTGDEVFDDGEPADAAALVGDELVVGRALPTTERDGWLIGVSSNIDEIDEWTIWFAEDSLKSTGYAEDLSQGDDDIWKPVPIGERDPVLTGRLHTWRDTICIDLLLDWSLEGEEATPEEERRIEALVDAAAAALAERVAIDEIEIQWRIIVNVGKASAQLLEEEPEAKTTWGKYAEIKVCLWLYLEGDLLESYERIVAEPSRAWLHGENSDGFLESTWEIPTTERVVFLVPGVREARVCCEYYSSPERLTRLEP
jgi:hypothetical protein